MHDLLKVRMSGSYEQNEKFALQKEMQATNLLKKVLKPRNLTPTPAQKKENVQSRRSSSAADSKSPGACSCAPTTHAGSFRCRLHRTTGRSHGLTPAAMPKSDGSKKPFKGSSSYTISSVDIQHPPRPTVPRPNALSTAAFGRNKHRHKPSRLSRMVKANSVSTDELAHTEHAGNNIISRSESVNDHMSGFSVDDMSADRHGHLQHQQVRKDPDIYAFDSELYAFEQAKGHEGGSGGLEKKLDTEQRGVTEIYTRLQETADILSPRELREIYEENLKLARGGEVYEETLKLPHGGTVKEPHERVLEQGGVEEATQRQEAQVQVQEVEEVPSEEAIGGILDLLVVEESKVYVEPLRIIDFKQEFLADSKTCTTFLVQWESLSVRDATWESSYFLSGYPELLKDYLQRRSEQGDSIEFFRAMEDVNSIKNTVQSTPTAAKQENAIQESNHEEEYSEAYTL